MIFDMIVEYLIKKKEGNCESIVSNSSVLSQVKDRLL